MNTVVVLDTGVLGMVVHPKKQGEPLECKQWLEDVLTRGFLVYVPEVADYELRRELMRLNATTQLARLDALKTRIGYAAITTTAMIKAAEFWAAARQAGAPTADPKELDCDAILAAQTTLIPTAGQHAIIATTNVGHLSLFGDARSWRDVP